MAELNRDQYRENLISELHLTRRDEAVEGRLSPADIVNRNVQAIEGALIRGDRRAELVNTDRLDQSAQRRLRIDHLFPQHDEDWGTDFAWRDRAKPPSEGSTLLPGCFHGFELRPIKAIAAGGHGIVTLAELRFEDNSTLNVVAKTPRKGGQDEREESVEEEAYWHRRYDGNSHIVQIVDPNKEAEKRRLNLGNHRGALRYDHFPEYNVKEHLILEYLQNGNLHDLLLKSVDTGETLSMKMLWELWECLVKGITAVAYQPYCTNSGMGTFGLLLRQAESSDDVDGFIAALRAVPITHDVHFDLEEQNIMIGRDSDHSHHPIFKLHDFGFWSRKMSVAWNTWRRQHYWFVRGPVKYGKQAPEQFHQDWDDLPLLEPIQSFQGEDLSRGSEIAGRYGAWTNVYFIANVMQGAITHCYRFQPFTAKEYTTLDGSKTARTYGWRLLNAKYRDRIDDELRDILCQCMFERPIDRPKAVDLLDAVLKRVRTGFAETDQETYNNWRRIFCLPYTQDVIQANQQQQQQQQQQQEQQPLQQHQPLQQNYYQQQQQQQHYQQPRYQAPGYGRGFRPHQGQPYSTQPGYQAAAPQPNTPGFGYYQPTPHRGGYRQGRNMMMPQPSNDPRGYFPTYPAPQQPFNPAAPGFARGQQHHPYGQRGGPHWGQPWGNNWGINRGNNYGYNRGNNRGNNRGDNRGNNRGNNQVDRGRGDGGRGDGGPANGRMMLLLATRDASSLSGESIQDATTRAQLEKLSDAPKRITSKAKVNRSFKVTKSTSNRARRLKSSGSTILKDPKRLEKMVEEALPKMPPAIHGLLSRTKELVGQLTNGRLY